ncbi:hypothetical protein [Paenibacillus sp. SYP-B4298]|uniref:hypothetical protein n=1 Tax=Paenibacillus sp. SYP-B4298 TaxID=2996034 RepID=UPI0022DDAF8A|nr:hypothetical protein [Paenibacillus sp. SYP-B4298]
MIKLTRPEKPKELTDEVVSELTKEFIETKKSVWKLKYIEDALLKSSHEKCCYCECKLDIESKYMEVEHYFDKSKNPDKVLEWKNLLPSCKRCNGKKSDHDTVLAPIINPYSMNPKEHLSFFSYRLRPETKIGETTIDLLDLNNSKKVVMARFEVAEAIHNQINLLYHSTLEYFEGKQQSPRRRNRIVSAANNILMEAGPSEEYCATISTEILHSIQFSKIKEMLADLHLWDEELTTLYDSIRENALNLHISKIIA